MVCQSIQTGVAAAPDVAASAESAASSLLQWVAVRNQALGLPAISTAETEGLKKAIVKDIADIANGVWKNNKGAKGEKRTQAANALKQQLRWLSWDEVK